MKILAVETSSKMGSVALLEEGQVVNELSQELDRRYSANLVPLIQQLLEKSRLALSGVDGYAVGLGPGSFTGIRVGMTTIKGLALVDKKPVVGISSLLALAYNAINGSSTVAPLVDAKRNLVYFAWYRFGDEGEPVERIPPGLGTLQEALSKMNQPALFIGDAAENYRKQIERIKGKEASFNGSIYQFPRASVVGKIAVEKFQKGESGPAGSLAPAYLYSRYCSIRGNR